MQEARSAAINSRQTWKIQADPWIAYYQPRAGARLRLFCFPHAGGSAALFRTWADTLPAEIEVCPVQLPGREQRLWEPPFTRLSLLVEHLVISLQQYLNLPFAFFGHSMGALIAYELARELNRQAYTVPIHLFVSGCPAPQIPAPASPVYLLPDAALIDHLRSLAGTPEAVLQNAELMQLMLPLIRADFTLYETYGYERGEPLPCPISTFGGLKDTEVIPRDLAGWREQTRASFTLRLFPGDHFYLQRTQAPLLREIVQELS